LGEPISASGKKRLRGLRKGIQAAERSEPLRRQILMALAQNGSTPPRDLAELLSSSRETMSRLLGDLQKSGFVEEGTDNGDRRLRPYSLTPAGETELNRHLAYGKKVEPSRRLEEKESSELLREAIERAVRLRRETNELEETRDRLTAVARESSKIGAQEIALDAQAELVKTMRQIKDFEAMDKVIDELEAISLGKKEGYDASFVLPAAAHYRYAVGRCGDRRGDRLPVRANHLATAASLYGQLAKSARTNRRKQSWLTHRAWSVLSLAGNLRKQTQLIRALHFAAVAKGAFDDLEDAYGRVHCLFMFGFCLRLLGEFKESWTCLSRAHDLAVERNFERARSETLMQMGEVCRCQGEVDEARVHLTESVELARHMELDVTEAFAFSALGAVEFQTHDLGGAQKLLTDAQGIFEACEHNQGRALNARRQAAVARRIAGESSNPNYAVIERWIDWAIKEYIEMRSPAGFAACQIEKGAVQLMRKSGNVGPVARALSELLGDDQDDQRRKTIQLDPWVPLLLKNFAHQSREKEAVPESFVRLADSVYNGASSRRSKDAARGLHFVSAVMEDFQLEDEDESDPLVAEMGSETRRQLTDSEQEIVLQQDNSAEEHTFALTM
jgi:DNA-binding MarR family transcriptional regulator